VKKTTSIAAFCFLLVSPFVLADSYLSADEVKTLLTGKTVIGHHAFKNQKGARYFDTSGITVGLNKGPGKWRVKSDGMRCVKNDGSTKEKCRYIKKDGDEYKLYKAPNNVMKGHKHVWTWTKIEDGNTQGFKLAN